MRLVKSIVRMLVATLLLIAVTAGAAPPFALGEIQLDRNNSRIEIAIPNPGPEARIVLFPESPLAPKTLRLIVSMRVIGSVHLLHSQKVETAAIVPVSIPGRGAGLEVKLDRDLDEIARKHDEFILRIKVFHPEEGAGKARVLVFPADLPAGS